MDTVKSNLREVVHSKKFILFVTLVGILAIMLVVGNNDSMPTAATPSKKELPIYCVDTKEKVVALTFDAAWGNEDTEEILKILEKNQVKATFFMTGGWVESYPQDVKAIADAGHDLGNHGENHKKMSELDREQCVEELEKVHKKVKEITGKDMILFRPPYGDYDDLVIKTARDIKYYPIQWDVDSLDWKNYGISSIVDTVVNHKALGCGSIILMHNGAQYTAKALQEVIDGLKNKGYSFVKVSDLIIKDEYFIDVTGRQYKK